MYRVKSIGVNIWGTSDIIGYRFIIPVIKNDHAYKFKIFN